MEKEYTITLEDNGRHIAFNIRRLPALQMESWLARMTEILPPEKQNALSATPTSLAEYILEHGYFALACAHYEKTAPLLEELLACCSTVDPESGEQISCSSQNINDLISDIETLLRLRKAALKTNLSFAFKDARKPLLLPKATAFNRAAAEQTFAKTVNVPQVAATLISHGAASLNDLRTTYTYDDALDLLEVINVRNYNQWAGIEAAKHRRR